jgi:hypothetical protein
MSHERLFRGDAEKKHLARRDYENMLSINK